MIVQTPGNVTERIILLGRKESNVYLLDGGTELVLLGGGMVHIAPEVLDQVLDFGVDVRKIRRIAILHSHFDHCGIVGFLRKQWPWVRVAASEAAKAMLAKPKVIGTIHAMNRQVLEGKDRLGQAEKMGFADFEGITVDEVLKDGMKVACGDRTLEILEVPGHSSCSIAVYVPEEKALFASDAGGIASGGEIFPAANSDFDKYMQSLEKMAARDTEVYLAEHYGARTGQEARDFLSDSMRAAGRFRQMVEDSLDRTGDPEQTAAELSEIMMQQAPPEFLPREIFSMIIGQMVHFLAKKRAG